MAEQAHRDTATIATAHLARTQASTQAQAPIVDSLRTDSIATTAVDYSQAYPYPVYGTADSLRMRYKIGSSVYQDVSAEAVFGTTSMRVREPQPPMQIAPAPIEDAVFQSFVLLLAALYAVLLYANKDDIHTLFERVWHDSRKRIFEDPGSGFTRFLHLVSAIGMLFAGLLAVKYGAALLPVTWHNVWSHGAVLILSLLASLVGIGWIAYQQILLRLAGAVLLVQSFVSQLIMLKRTYFSLGTILIVPMLLLCVLCPPHMGGLWSILLIAAALLVFIIYLIATLNLFLSKKISILHWFLYLCTVEVFPISLLWLIAVR